MTCHVTLLGGGFGRKSKPDYVVEAALLSKKVGAPVKIVWSREDDLQFDYFHAPAAQYLKAAIGPDGLPTAWLMRTAFPSIGSLWNAAGPVRRLAGPTGLDRDPVSTSRASRRERAGARARARRLARSVASIHHAYAASGASPTSWRTLPGADRVEYLLKLMGPDRSGRLRGRGMRPAGKHGASWADHPLDSARPRRVVELASTEKAGWAGKLPRGRGRGLAMHRSFLSYIAMVVEVEVLPDGTVLVPRTTVAVDAGFIANPDRAQGADGGGADHGDEQYALQRDCLCAGEGGAVELSRRLGSRGCARRRGWSTCTWCRAKGCPGGIGEPAVPPAGGR